MLFYVYLYKTQDNLLGIFFTLYIMNIMNISLCL
jgi:hypothetical protein